MLFPSKKVLLSISLLFLVVASSCVQNPIWEQDKEGGFPHNALIVLCEGLWGMDNSTFDIISNHFTFYEKGVYQKFNGKILGDTANDIIISGDTLFICVSSSKYIELVSLASGKSIKRYFFNGNFYPRRMVKVGSEIFITDLYNDCLHKIDLNSDTLLTGVVKTGSAPEYICSDGLKLFVVNSGYGDYKFQEEGAGELWVIDRDNLVIEQKIFIGLNPIEVQISSDFKKIYASYVDLPSKKDSLGGIVEFSNIQGNLIKQKEWKCKPAKITVFQNSVNTNIFFIDEKGVNLIDNNEETPLLIIPKQSIYDNLYALGVSKDKSFLFVGNAKNHAIDGEVSIYNMWNILSYKQTPDLEKNIIPLYTFTTSINPSKFLEY